MAMVSVDLAIIKFCHRGIISRTLVSIYKNRTSQKDKNAIFWRKKKSEPGESENLEKQSRQDSLQS